MTEEPGTVAGSGWTEKEIFASVDTWVRMYKMQQSGSPFVKAKIIRALQANELSIRSRSSVERRFMNISAVSLALEHEIVQGFQPLGNVGTKIWERIQSRLQTHGFGIEDIESSIEDEMNILMQSGLDGFEASRIRERAWQQVTQRRGQSRFRTMLLDAYDNKCAVTRINEPMVLEAAHIEPYSGPASNVAQNGLLLKSDIHKLFDRGVLVIQPDLTTMIAPSLQNGPFAIHDGQRIRVPERQAFRPSPSLLEKHMVSAMETW
jgi:5-methylcytosine-specific restriction enzyme A